MLKNMDCVIVMESDMEKCQVSFNLDKNSIYFSCHMFESFGILCCHCLRFFIHMNIKLVLEYYILKRWTKLARSETLSNVNVSNMVEDVHQSTSQHYKEICLLLINISNQACKSPKTSKFLCKVANQLNKHILKFQNNPTSISQVDEFVDKFKEISSRNYGSSQVKGFKKRKGQNGAKLLKVWVERQVTKRKKKDTRPTYREGKRW